MIFRLIIRNIKRNFQNYRVYFLTLTLSIALFYAYNSISAVEGLSNMSETKMILVNSMGELMPIISIGVSIGLSFLIIYSNNFIMKRRKKELGLYFLLGMEERKISALLTGELVLIGIISLGVGILLGFVLSNFLALGAIKLFNVDMAKYKFFIDPSAIKFTVFCFILIFAFTIIMNLKLVKKLKVIDLLYAQVKNEEPVNIGKYSPILFIFSVVLLIFMAYFTKKVVCENTINYVIKQLPYIAIGYFIGVVIFFHSLAGFMQGFLRRSSKIYYKGLNTFFFRQLTGRIKSNSITISILCLFLTGALTVLSLGISSALTMNYEAKKAAPYDIAVLTQGLENAEQDILKSIQDYGLDLESKIEEYVEINLRDSGVFYKEILGEDTEDLWKIDKEIKDMIVPAISLTDYNRLMGMTGNQAIQLEENEYYINCNYKGTYNKVNDFLKDNNEIEISNTKLKPATDRPLESTITMTSVGNNDRGTLIIPDKIADNLKNTNKILNGIYKEGVEKEKLTQEINGWVMSTSWTDNDGFHTDFAYQTKDRLYDMYYGTIGTAVFLTTFIGLIFTIITLTILSLQQLMNALDYANDYELLSTLGAEKGKVNATSLKQIVFYFLTPLILAIPISIAFSKNILYYLETFINIPIGQRMQYSFLAMMAVYSLYLVLTYSMSKPIIQNSFEKRD